MQRICLTVQYNGANYHGWQVQKNLTNLLTVQGVLESALSQIANHSIKLIYFELNMGGCNGYKPC